MASRDLVTGQQGDPLAPVSLRAAIKLSLQPGKLQHDLAHASGQAAGRDKDPYVLCRRFAAQRTVLRQCCEQWTVGSGQGRPAPAQGYATAAGALQAACRAVTLCKACKASQQAAVSSARTQNGARFTLVQVSRPDAPLPPSMPPAQVPANAWRQSPASIHLEHKQVH